MKLKVGDYVRIKEGLNEEDTKNFAKEMEKYCGKVAKITEVNSESYSLNIDNERWYWNEHMVESVQTYNIIVAGNTVTVTDEKGNTGVARCSPEDEFNISTGISLALERLKWKPNCNEYYWTIDFKWPNWVREYVWGDDITDKKLFKEGVVFKTKKEAIEVAKKMLDSIR